MSRWRHIAPPAAAAAGLIVFAVVLAREVGVYRAAIRTWAERDMRARAEIAAEALGSAPKTLDLRRLRTFGEECAANGVRLTVLTAPGGLIYDTSRASRGSHADRPEVAAAIRSGEGLAMRKSRIDGAQMLYCARRADGFVVRLAIPAATVFAPADHARRGLLLAGLVGASGILAVFAFLWRLSRRNRELARERDEQSRRVAEMERAVEFRRAFVSNVTHEIKTPLTGILGAVNLLAGEDDLPNADRRELLEMLRRESLRLDGLTKDILQLAKLEHEESAGLMQPARFDLAAVAEAAAARVRHLARERNVALAVNAAPAEIEGDAQLAEQAIVNLLENAIRHSGGKNVELGVARAGGKVTAAVRDDGAGIAPEHCARIFERFYRVDKSRSRDAGGTGLGLSIVKHIMRMHGGDATVQSAPGAGSLFTLEFPAAQHLDQSNARKGNKP